MCGGASKVMIRTLNLPSDVESRLLSNGLGTAQALIDEGKAGLEALGISPDDILGISEAVNKETGMAID
ncbi:MAG: hypothetical protein KIH67_003605 [Candidatus Moranbacteria bacterium]|nr:hypothetical protein [Candidatus Moranbacteria bacterium]